MERIGRYEILRELGRGGFGRVYLANDPLMKCEVAIKVMSNADDPEMLARFRDEAASARKLRHESIVTIYDVGETQGVPYIVMEYLQGSDLQKIREQNVPLSLLQKVRILSQVAAGLQVAHDNGIIHRDVKPANIMVQKDGSVKIMDFGIARVNLEGATHHTRTGVVVGTLQYIPPEQFEGHAADPLADLWAFGVIAYQLFSGRNPFDAAETMQVIYNITSLPIPDLHQLNPEVPEDLCRIVRKLLMRDRAARYQAFEDVRLDLNPVLEGLEGVEANRLVDDARMRAAHGDLQSAHHIVRQVLERYPSNAQAKQIRDHIITQIRANEVTRQVEELLIKGDRDLTAGSYEEAVNSFRQACRLSPGSSTARMRMERAQQLADRARRIRDEMKEARARLAAGDPQEALRILAGVLADDPDNVEAPGLLMAAQQEQARQTDAARADAILYARHLVTQRQFAQAIEVLAACARKVGDHAGLQQVVEEVRRAEAAATTQARIDTAMANAGEHVRKGEFAAASMILAPLAAEFPAHADIRELVKFAAQEEARARRATERLASVEEPVRPATPPPIPSQPTMPESAIVIERALGMSRVHQRSGQMDEAVHVLDVALSRYPDAAGLVEERQRLLAPKPEPLDWLGRQPPAASPPLPPLTPPRSPGPDIRTVPIAHPQAPAQPSRRTLWAGVGTAGMLLFAGLGYLLFLKPTPPVPERQAATQSPATQAAVNTATPSPVPAPSAPVFTEPVSNAPVEVPVKKSEPSLASLLPRDVTFVYHRGDPSTEKVLNVERSPLNAAVIQGGNWLAASASAGRVVFSLKTVLAASLALGPYTGAVRVTSNREKALVPVSLMVEASRVPEKPVATTPVKKDLPPPPVQAVPTVSSAVPAVKKPYNGPRRGTANWSGSLPAGGRLVLGESGVLEGGGALTGSEIPPTDVQVDVTFPKGLETQALPPTGAQRVVITNSTGAPVSQIRLNWSIK